MREDVNLLDEDLLMRVLHVPTERRQFVQYAETFKVMQGV